MPPTLIRLLEQLKAECLVGHDRQTGVRDSDIEDPEELSRSLARAPESANWIPHSVEYPDRTGEAVKHVVMVTVGPDRTASDRPQRMVKRPRLNTDCVPDWDEPKESWVNLRTPYCLRSESVGDNRLSKGVVNVIPILRGAPEHNAGGQRGGE